MKIMVALAMLAACAFALTGCSLTGARYTYDHADLYTSGGTAITGEIRKLDINWIDGKVEIRYHGGATELTETSQKRTSADTELHWWLDGDTLHVQYCRSGKRIRNGLGKTLTVTLPEGIQMEEIDVKGVSCDLALPMLDTEKVVIGIVSGNVMVKGRVGDLRVDSVSGNVTYEASSQGPVKIVTVSGNVSCAVNGTPDLKIDTISGNIGVTVEEDRGFILKFSSVSGECITGRELMLGQDGKALIYGDGSGRIDTVTVSGDMKLDWGG